MNKFLNLLVCFSLICTTVSAAGPDGSPESLVFVQEGLDVEPEGSVLVQEGLAVESEGSVLVPEGLAVESEGSVLVPEGLAQVLAEKLFSLPVGSPFALPVGSLFVLSVRSPFVGTTDSSSPFSFQDEFFTGAEARARAAVMKRTGAALLISGGVLSTTGVALYGAAIASLDHDLGTAGLAVTGASLPFYIAGAILHVKGKKGMLEAAPGSLCLRF